MSGKDVDGVKINNSIKKKRIAFYIPRMTFGGAERVIINLLKGLERQNKYILDLVLLEAKGEFLVEIPKNVNVISLNVSREYSALFPLSKYLKKYKPYMFFSNYCHISAIISIKFIFKDIKLVLMIHDLKNNHSLNGAKCNTYIRFILEKYLFGYADEIVVVSHAVYNNIIDLYKISTSKICIIHNPIDIEDINKKKDMPLHLETGTPWVIAVGRLVPEKNFYFLIKAIELLLKGKKSCKLIILGDGADKASLNDYIRLHHLENNIYLYGFSDNPYKYMKQADIVLISSRSEGFCYTALEALACGTFVVSTKCGGIEDILIDNDYGVLINDEQEMAKAIKEVLDKKQVTNQKAICRANEFSIDEIVKKYIKLIEKEFYRNLKDRGE